MTSPTLTSTTKHVPVLLHESIDALNLSPGRVFLDGTLGGGGHSREVLRRFPQVRIIALDQDPEAIERVEKELKIETRMGNFRDLDKILVELNIEKVDAILFDLGLSTDQLSPTTPGSGRGFSFLKDEPLDMRASGQGIKANDILNSWDERAIELILRGFGEEKFSRKIARAVVERRKIKPFQVTSELVKVILGVKPRSKREKIHPATKTFQALRIATNEELTNLEIGLEKGFEALNSNGRFAVISFHSLEDRIVKNFFRNKIKEMLARPVTNPTGKQSRKPTIPSEEESQINPRARSAKLRVIEKI